MMQHFPPEVLDEVRRHLSEVFTTRQTTNIKPLTDPALIREELGKFRFDQPQEATAAYKQVAELLQAYNINITHPGYFGLFNPAVTPAAVLGDILAAVYNPQLAAWSHAPFCNEMEQLVLTTLADRLGYTDSNRFFHFTSGGSEANHTALLVALAHHYPSYLKDGVFALKKRPVVYVSAFAHNSFDKAVKNVGLGEASLCKVPVNANYEMDLQALKVCIRNDRAAGKQPFMIVATAGTTSYGTIDPILDLFALSREESLWLHVDGAWGGLAGLSASTQSYLAGMDEADSITIDAHKWMNVPMGAGMFFTRHKQAVLDAFRIPADYMPKPTEGAYDPYNTTLQWSRRAIGLKVFMAMTIYGLDGIIGFMEHQIELGAYLKSALQKAGFELLNDTPFPLACFTHPVLSSGRVAIMDVLQNIYDEGHFWISTVATLKGERAFRACITSLHSDQSHIDALVDRLSELVNI